MFALVTQNKSANIKNKLSIVPFIKRWITKLSFTLSFRVVFSLSRRIQLVYNLLVMITLLVKSGWNHSFCEVMVIKLWYQILWYYCMASWWMRCISITKGEHTTTVRGYAMPPPPLVAGIWRSVSVSCKFVINLGFYFYASQVFINCCRMEVFSWIENYTANCGMTISCLTIRQLKATLSSAKVNGRPLINSLDNFVKKRWRLALHNR